ncbi:hypothetical protein LINPERHAP2_LOCUS30042 [Linum perenne]
MATIVKMTKISSELPMMKMKFEALQDRFRGERKESCVSFNGGGGEGFIGACSVIEAYNELVMPNCLSSFFFA